MEPGLANISFSPMDSALPTISSRSRCRRLEEAGNDLGVTAVGGIDAYFLTLTHARIAAFPAEQIEHPPVYEKTERAVQSSLCRRACRQVESRRAEAEKNRVTSVSSRNQASYSEPPGMTTTSPGPQTCCAEAELHHPESSSQCGWIPDPLVPLVAAQRRRHSLLHAPESHPANV